MLARGADLALDDDPANRYLPWIVALMVYLAALALAGEPTGNLDPETAGRVFDMLLDVVRETGLAALIATHNHDLASRMDRTVRLEGGVIRAA